MTIKMYCRKDDKVKCVVIDQNIESKKKCIDIIRLNESITKRSIQIKCVFLNPLMTKALTAEYNPNDMIVVVIAESGEQ